MSNDALTAALGGLRVRVPESAADADALRAEVRAADAALGEWLRTASDRRGSAAPRHDGGDR